MPKPTRYQRIKAANDQIRLFHQTIWPDNTLEVKNRLISSLESLIHEILEEEPEPNPNLCQCHRSLTDGKPAM